MANIVDTAVSAGTFRTLVTALEAAGLADALKGGGPWTVFAPNDAAFSKLPSGTLESLLQDIPKLKNILLYHVVDGQYMAEDVMEEDELETVQGQSVEIDVSEAITVNNARVVQADVQADNGVIHVVDSVILPKVESVAGG